MPKGLAKSKVWQQVFRGKNQRAIECPTTTFVAKFATTITPATAVGRLRHNYVQLVLLLAS